MIFFPYIFTQLIYYIFIANTFKLYFIIDGDLLVKKESGGKLTKLKVNVINFDQSIDNIQPAEEVKSDNDVILAVGDEASAISTNSYDKIVRFIS